MSSDLEARVKTLEDLVQAIQRCFIAPPTPTPQPQAKAPPAILSKFTPEQAARLEAEKTTEGWKLNPAHFLPTAQWQEINTVVKTLGGKYTPATNGVPGHWMVPA